MGSRMGMCSVVPIRCFDFCEASLQSDLRAQVRCVMTAGSDIEEGVDAAREHSNIINKKTPRSGPAFSAYITAL